MNLADIASIRLISQQIATTKSKTVKETIEWLGAMQAQDYEMAKWGIGVRIANSTDQLIESSIDKGEIIRTHLLRPTWHFVSADDIYWMLELSAPRIKAMLKSRHKQLEITETVIKKSHNVIVNALSQGSHLTRKELVIELEKSGIVTKENRAAHLLMLAELDKIICSGKTKARKQTYAIFSERVPHKKKITRDEAMAELAKKYFTSHCPATLQDFAWWSGLSIRDAEQALEMIKPTLISEDINSLTYWISGSYSPPKVNEKLMYLLPAYDEFVISYKDRSSIFSVENQKKTISSNGMFWPTIVLNGKVKGLWKRKVKKDTVSIEANLFEPLPQKIKKLIEKKAISFGNFFEKKTEIFYL